MDNSSNTNHKLKQKIFFIWYNEYDKKYIIVDKIASTKYNNLKKLIISKYDYYNNKAKFYSSDNIENSDEFNIDDNQFDEESDYNGDESEKVKIKVVHKVDARLKEIEIGTIIIIISRKHI